MGYEIRQVHPDDWPALREVRLTALTDAPYAFMSTLERESGYDEARWRQWIAGSACFLAWDGGQPAGLVGGLLLDNGEWHVVSMWVSPQARGSGVARQLLEAAVTTGPACSTSAPGSFSPVSGSRCGRVSRRWSRR
jgi:ribosomal protein S18 acetylase RimI-like enzyme